MKKLVLNGRQIRLLLKVKKAEYGFYPQVESFLKENESTGEEETIELEIEDDDVFNDVTEMVNYYLEDDSLKEADKPSEAEVIELKELLNQLNPDQSEESAGDTTVTEEEK